MLPICLFLAKSFGITLELDRRIGEGTDPTSCSCRCDASHLSVSARCDLNAHAEHGPLVEGSGRDSVMGVNRKEDFSWRKDCVSVLWVD